MELQTFWKKITDSWIQGKVYHKDDQNNEFYCMLGAIGEAGVNNPFALLNIILRPAKLLLIRETIGHYLRNMLKTEYCNIGEWNDAEGRTVYEVTGVLRNCASILRKKGEENA